MKGKYQQVGMLEKKPSRTSLWAARALVVIFFALYVWAALTVPLLIAFVMGASIFASGALAMFVVAKLPPRLMEALVLFHAWTLWRFAGFRRIDITAFAEMVSDGAYECVPLDIFVTSKGTTVVTQALLPAPEPVSDIESLLNDIFSKRPRDEEPWK